MKKIIAICLACVLTSGFLYAQQTSDETPPALNFNGSLLLDDRIKLNDGELSWQEYRMELRPSYRIGKKARFYADIWVRKLLTSYLFEQPAENVRIREAYVDLYGFLTDNLDIRVGRQRIAWGTADKLNPTDNINPWELEDFWDFGRHTPTNSLQAKYYWNDFTFTAVFTPQFTPSILPDQSWTAAFMPLSPQEMQIPLPGGNSLHIVPSPITIAKSETLPHRKLNAATYAFKVSKNISSYTVSAGWMRQHSPMPMLTSLDIKGEISGVPPNSQTAEMNTLINATLSYPQRNVLTADFSGAIRSIGVWGEAALFMPQETILTTNVLIESPLGVVTPHIPDSIVLSKKPYLKYTLGFDYTFPSNIYLNMQYVHGFFHEEGNANLKDYLAWVFEWKSRNERFKIAPINGMIQINGDKNLKDTFSLFWIPEFSYKPVDNVDIIIGMHCIFADQKSPFYAVKENSDAYCKVKFSF